MDDIFTRNSIVTRWDSFESNVFFFSSLNVSCLIGPLRQCGLLTKKEAEKLRNLATTDFDFDFETNKAKTCFFRIMKTKGPAGYPKFLTALRNEKEHLGHKDLYDSLPKPGGGLSCSEPVETQKEKFYVFDSRRSSFGKTKGTVPSVESVSEDLLEQVLERLEALEKKSSGNQQLPYPVDHKEQDKDFVSEPQSRKPTSQIVGLSSLNLQSLVHLKNSLEEQATPLDVHQSPFVLDNFEVDCAFSSLQVKPLAFNFKIYFVTTQSLSENQKIQEVKIYDLKNKYWSEGKNITGLDNTASLCPTMLTYLNKITLFGSGPTKAGLYSFDVLKKLWTLVNDSEFSFKNLDIKNSACYRYGTDSVVVVTVFQAFIYFHLFSPSRKDDAQWKAAKLLLSKQISNFQLQSCVVASNYAFCALLTCAHLLIYQVDLSPLEQADGDTCYLKPSSSWLLDNSSIKNCFLSILNDEVVTIMVKEMNDKKTVEVSELKHFNLGSLRPLTTFNSVVVVDAATVVSDTTYMAIVCHDSDMYKLHILNVSNAVEVEKIDKQFDYLISQLIQVVKNADFSKLHTAYVENTDLRLVIPQNIEEKVMQAEDFESFINGLKPAHCNWLNFTCLEKVARQADIIFGTKNATDLVTQFIENLYAMSIKEVTQQIQHITMDHYVQIRETWNKDLNNTTVESLVKHQEQLALLLHIAKDALVLQKILISSSDSEIHWAIPVRLANQVKITANNTAHVYIKNYGILNLEVGSEPVVMNDHCPVTEESDINEGDTDTAMVIKEIDPVSETEPPRPIKKELETLRKYYPDLIHTLTDIDSLLPHCVKENIISFQENDNILAEKISSRKVIKLLEHVSGPLESGSSGGFYDLLKIMKSEGKAPTKDLANKMEKSLM